MIFKKGILLMAFKALNAGLGFGLSLGLAMILGADSGTDALLIALFIPVVIGQSLIPMICIVVVPVIVQEKNETGNHFPPGAGPATIGAALCIGILTFAFPESIVTLMGPGLQEASKTTACELVRILIPAFILITMFGLSQSYYYANKHFYRPETGRFTWRAACLAGLVFIGPTWGVRGYAWCVLAASLLQLLFVFPGPFLSKEFRQIRCPRNIKKRLTMATLTVGTSAFLGWAIQICIRSAASLYGKGVLTIIDYSDRLAQFIPLLMARSFFTLMLPELATLQEKGETGAELAGYVGVMLFLFGVPLAGAIYLFTPDIAQLLCSYSKIPVSSADTMIYAIRGFTLGIPAILGHMSLKGVFLVGRKIKETAVVELIQLFFFGTGFLILYRSGPGGITTSVSLSSWGVLFFLWRALSLSISKWYTLRTGAGITIILASCAFQWQVANLHQLMIPFTSFLLYIGIVGPVWNMCNRQLKKEYNRINGADHVN